jgi:MYXO-CTERM domain-containing protein
MRRTLAIASLTAALLFGGAGVANATATDEPISASTTTTVAQMDNDHHKSDKTGLWGLLGLLGLGGLAGLLRRKETYPGAGPTGIGRGTTPPAA